MLTMIERQRAKQESITEDLKIHVEDKTFFQMAAAVMGNKSILSKTPTGRITEGMIHSMGLTSFKDQNNIASNMQGRINIQSMNGSSQIVARLIESQSGYKIIIPEDLGENKNVQNVYWVNDQQDTYRFVAENIDQAKELWKQSGKSLEEFNPEFEKHQEIVHSEDLNAPYSITIGEVAIASTPTIASAVFVVQKVNKDNDLSVSVSSKNETVFESEGISLEEKVKNESINESSSNECELECGLYEVLEDGNAQKFPISENFSLAELKRGNCIVFVESNELGIPKEVFGIIDSADAGVVQFHRLNGASLKEQALAIMIGQINPQDNTNINKFEEMLNLFDRLGFYGPGSNVLNSLQEYGVLFSATEQVLIRTKGGLSNDELTKRSYRLHRISSDQINRCIQDMPQSFFQYKGFFSYSDYLTSGRQEADMVKEIVDWVGDFPISSPYDMNPANVVQALSSSKNLQKGVMITKTEEVPNVSVVSSLDESSVEKIYEELMAHHPIEEAERKASRRLKKYIANFPHDHATQAVYQNVLNRIKQTKNEDIGTIHGKM